MPTALKLRLSGPFSAEASDGRVLDIALRGQVILAYLAVDGRGAAARSEIADLIWSDRGEEQARASLRQELSALRRALPKDVLTADRARVVLALEQVEILPPAGTRPLLDGVSLRSQPFEDWLRDARSRDMAARLKTALVASETTLPDDPAEAAQHAQSALALDPTSEVAIRWLMRAEEARGNRAAALTAYERFRARLSEELDAEPGAETETLATELRQGKPKNPPRKAENAKTLRPSDKPTLAVLAFEEFGANPGDMFADGVVEEITSALSRVHEFHVIARQSAFSLRHKGLDHTESAARLGADYLAEGSVRRAGDRVRIAVQLVGAREGHTIWSERFDDRIGDLFELQDRIAAQVAGQLSPNLRAAEIALAGRRAPKDRTAYELTLTALPHFWSHRKDEHLTAMKYFDQAIERAPDYGPALAYKAWSHAHLCCYIWTADPAEERRRAIEVAERAAAVARDHAPSLVAIGAAISLTTMERERARSFIDRALIIDPNNAWGWLRSGWLHSLNNFPEMALEHFDRAEALSPLDPFLFNVRFGRANSLAEMGHLKDAVALVKEGLNMAPGVTWAYRMLASYYGNMGDMKRSQRALNKFLEHYPGITIRKMRDSMPPSIFETQPVYVEGLRRAGIPEE